MSGDGKKASVRVREAVKADCPEIIRLIQVKKKTKQRITTWNVRNSEKNKTKDLANYEEMPDGPKIDAKGREDN